MSEPTADEQRPMTLAYEPAPQWVRPPAWVIGVVGAYLLLVTGLVGMPGIAALDGAEDIAFWPLGVAAAGLMLAWMSLLWIPVRLGRRRRVTRRSLWVPIVGSGFLAALLLFGLTLAVAEWAAVLDDDWIFGGAVIAAAATWGGWATVFWVVSRRKDPEGFGVRLYKVLLAGSALELLVAVPAHVIVRRRGECCAGVGTGIGICCGLAVMIVALGPGVAVLYYRRVKQISGSGHAGGKEPG